MTAPATYSYRLMGGTIVDGKQAHVRADIAGASLADALHKHLDKVGRKQLGIIRELHIYLIDPKTRSMELVCDYEKSEFHLLKVAHAKTAIQRFCTGLNVVTPTKPAEPVDKATETATRATISALKDAVAVDTTFIKKCTMPITKA